MDNLKYNIGYRLKKMPGITRINHYKLCIYLEIHEETLSRWMATKRDNKFSIPSDQFYLIAKFFEVNPDELLNNNTVNA